MSLKARKRTRASAEQCVEFGKTAHLLALLRPAGGRKSKARRTVDRLSVALEYGGSAAFLFWAVEGVTIGLWLAGRVCRCRVGCKRLTLFRKDC